MQQINWQEFENLARSLVRDWGFQVGNKPIKRYNRAIDIVGPHILIKKAVARGLPQKPLEFVGECRAWAAPIDIGYIDQLVGLRENFIADHIPTITAIISKTGFTDRAIKRAKKQDILVLDMDDIIRTPSQALLQKSAGIISRKSFPFYQSLNCLFAILEVMKNST